MLDFLKVDTSGVVDHLVLWLHGLGADGHDFESLVDELDIPHTLGVRFIFPHAKIQPVTLNGGMRMRSWYDIRDLDLLSNLDTDGIQESVLLVQEILEDQIRRGIPARNCILAGFSQGGLIALQLGLHYAQPLAGILALSTYCPNIATEGPNAGTPVFWGHGSFDPIVPVSLGRDGSKQLEQQGNPIEFHEYRMPHSVCPEDIHDFGVWLNRILQEQR